MPLSRRRVAACLALLIAAVASGTLKAQTAPPRLSARITAIDTPDSLDRGEVATAIVELTNTGAETWPDNGPVRLAYHWRRLDGRPLVRDGRRTLLSAPVAPGGSLRVCAQLEAPNESGALELQWDLVKEGETWFSGSDAHSVLVQTVHVREAIAPGPPRETARLRVWLAVTLFHLLISLWWGFESPRAISPAAAGRLEAGLLSTAIFALGTLHGVLFVASMTTGLHEMRGVWWLAAWDALVAVTLTTAWARARRLPSIADDDAGAADVPSGRRGARLADRLMAAGGALALLALAVGWLEVSARSLHITGSDAAHYHAPHAVRFALGASPFDLLATPHVYPMGTSLMASWFLLPLGNPLLIDVVMLGAFLLLATALMRLFQLLTGQPGLVWVPWFLLAVMATPLMRHASFFSADLPFAAGFLAATAQLVACWMSPRQTWRGAVTLGLSFGLLCASKTTGAAAMALLLVATGGVRGWSAVRRWRTPLDTPKRPQALARVAGLATVALAAWLAGGGMWLVRNELRFGSPVAPSGLRVFGVTIFRGESFAESSRYYSVADEIATSGASVVARRAAYYTDRWLGPILWPAAGLVVLLLLDTWAARRRDGPEAARLTGTLTSRERLIALAGFAAIAAALVWLLIRAPWTSLSWTAGLSLRYALPVIVAATFCSFLALFPYSWRWYERWPARLAGWLLIVSAGLGLFLRSRVTTASLDPTPVVDGASLAIATLILALLWCAAHAGVMRAAVIVGVALCVWPLATRLAARSAGLVVEVQREEARRVTCAAAGIDAGLDRHEGLYAAMLADERRRDLSCPSRRVFVAARFDASLAFQSMPYGTLVADTHTGEVSDAELRSMGRSPCDYIIVPRAELDTMRGSPLLNRAMAVRPWRKVAERDAYAAFAVTASRTPDGR